MTGNARIRSIPEELKPLGAIRRLFEPSAASLGMSTVRGLFPMVIGTVLFLAAPRWFPLGGWKQPALAVVGALLFLNGLRVVLTALSRRGQKVATFENGFAIWRNRAIGIYRWDQIDEIEVSPQFFGFRVWCRSAQGRKEKIHFDTASDPTDQLRLLWRDLEEQCWRHRLPAVLQSIANGEEAVFVKKTWGKVTGTTIGVSQFGIAATPRYKGRRFLDWLEVESLRIEDEHLVVQSKAEAGFWLREHIMAVPGCAAIVEAGEDTRRRYLELVQQVVAQRCGPALAQLAELRDVVVGNIRLTPVTIFEDGSSRAAWSDVQGARLDGDSLTYFIPNDEVVFDVEPLSFPERVFLRVMPEQIQATRGGSPQNEEPPSLREPG